jgi:ABC-type nitrate/sulfonate/bicarbonate transport system permease component
MVNEKLATDDVLLDVKIAEASRLYKFYLNQESKILGTAAVIVFMVLWEFMGGTLSAYNPISFLRVNPMFMSAPSLIFKAAVDLFSSGEIYNDLKISSIEFFWGYILAVVFAIPVGILTGWYKKMSYLCDPFINAMNATPRVALLPLVIIWLGIGILSKVGIIFLGAVFPMLINARDGVKTTPLSLINAAKSFGASEWQIFKSGLPVHRSLPSNRLKNSRRAVAGRRYGRGTVCGDRGHRVYDYCGRGNFPDRQGIRRCFDFCHRWNCSDGHSGQDRTPL